MKRVIAMVALLVGAHVGMTQSAYAQGVQLDPNIVLVSSGPMKWLDDNRGVRLKVVAVQSEVKLDVFVQRVEYGEESCCAKVVSTNQVQGSENASTKETFAVSDVVWSSSDSVSMTIDGVRVVVEDVGESPRYRVVPK